MSEIIPIFLGVSFAVAASTIGDILLARGMRRVGAFEWKGLSEVPKQVKAVVTTPEIPAAVVFLAVFFFSWLALLSRADLSLILPMTATTYVLNGLAAGPFLGEKVGRRRWAGIWIITIGVVFVTLTGGDGSH